MANSNVFARKSCQSRPQNNNNNSTTINVSNIDPDSKSNFVLHPIPSPNEGESAVLGDTKPHSNEKGRRRPNGFIDRNGKNVEGRTEDGQNVSQLLAGIEGDGEESATVHVGQKDIFDSEASEAAPPAWFGVKESSPMDKREDGDCRKRCDKSDKGGADRGHQLPANIIGQQEHQHQRQEQREERYRCGFEDLTNYGRIPWNEWSSNAAYCYS